jgi:hypothetical protein
MTFEGRILCFNTYDDEMVVWKNRVDRWKHDTWESYAISLRKAAGDKVAELGSLSKESHTVSMR